MVGAVGVANIMIISVLERRLLSRATLAAVATVARGWHLAAQEGE
jgi:hypothetical protein